LHYKLLPSAKSQSSVVRERSSSVFELLVAPHLVTSA
jgi:hypothetical protein